MAFTGVPKVLDNTIVSILESYFVHNWSIFGESDGNICIKIRFKAQGEGQGSSDVQNIAYRRKSAKQVTRDRNRVNKRKRVNSSEAENSIECARQCEKSPIQDSILDNQCSPVSIIPNDLEPLTEEIRHGDDFDPENIQNSLDSSSTLSDSEISQNSTSCAAANLDIPEADDLFLEKENHKSVNPAPESKVIDHVLRQQMAKLHLLNRLRSGDPELQREYMEYQRKNRPGYKSNSSNP